MGASRLEGASSVGRNRISIIRVYQDGDPLRKTQPVQINKNANDTNLFFYLGFVAGCAATVFAMAAVLALAFAKIDGVYAFLEEWQTLISAIIALGAAVPTVRLLSQQITLEHSRASDQIEREQFAAKTALPAGLVGITDYANTALHALREIETLFNDHDWAAAPENYRPPALPILPAEAVRLLEAAVKSADGANREALAWVLRRLQIVNSRLENSVSFRRPREVLIRHGWSSLVTDFLEFKIRASKLFAYARGETDLIDGTISEEELLAAALSSDIETGDYPSLDDAIARRAASPVR